jgi:hypothetical protein
MYVSLRPLLNYTVRQSLLSFLPNPALAFSILRIRLLRTAPREGGRVLALRYAAFMKLQMAGAGYRRFRQDFERALTLAGLEFMAELL